jgi:hypothetical protein
MRGTPCDVPLPRKMNENDMIKIFFRCWLPAYSIQPRMHTDKHNAFCVATAGLDCGGKRSATPLSETVTQKAVSPLSNLRSIATEDGRSSLRCASPRQAATAVHILSVSIRGCKIYRDKI